MAFNVFDESPENELVLKEQQSSQQQNKVVVQNIILIFDRCGIFSMNFFGDFGISAFWTIGL
jgi:hypothetical protein